MKAQKCKNAERVLWVASGSARIGKTDGPRLSPNANWARRFVQIAFNCSSYCSFATWANALINAVNSSRWPLQDLAVGLLLAYCALCPTTIGRRAMSHIAAERLNSKSRATGSGTEDSQLETSFQLRFLCGLMLGVPLSWPGESKVHHLQQASPKASGATR